MKRKVKLDPAFELYEWSQTLVHTLCAAVLIFFFPFGLFDVMGSSMLDTLSNGETVMLYRFPYTPRNGDIVVFTHRGSDISEDFEEGRSENLVKRIIGTEGDYLRYDVERGVLFRNDQPLDELYLGSGISIERLGGLAQGVLVPEDCVYVLGDNRAISIDSRSKEIGFVYKRTIHGKVFMRIYPLERFGFL
ncbi:MAG: signal peptidase I [Oscillospiraceae bacterium]|nr:signal peptidase I [Oscillospiraceae bacterium]